MEKIDIRHIYKWGVITVSTILLCLVIFYFAMGDSLFYNTKSSDMITGSEVIGELVDEYQIQQSFTAESDYLSGVSLFVGTYNRENQGILTLKVVDADTDNMLGETSIDVASLKDNSLNTISFNNWVRLERGKVYLLDLTTSGCKYGSSITIYYSSTETKNGDRLSIDGEVIGGELCFQIVGKNDNIEGKYYWSFVAILIGTSIIYCVYTIRLFKKNEKSKIIEIIETYIHYKFLIKQLISRDFKTKYKRSVLGFLWSFLNPLLTMIVQYIVFSRLFKSDIENYPIYLLSAGIVFNFFTESVGQGLGSIVMNASLITKVYIPKYIYPVSKVLSTSINMFISLVPLTLAVLITGERLNIAYLTLPFLFITLIVFCIGMSFLLSAAMVFFRDTQFLWGIVSLLWMYATPIFYPESIIPEHFSFILIGNPMYHYIKFFRIVLLQGIAPQPVEFFYCIFYAVLMFAVGNFIFKKTEKKFVLNI